jgi:hypothetical protein
MKRNKLEKYESKITPETSPEHLKQAREIAVNMIMNVFERMPKDNIKPVKESFAELARQAKSGIVRQPTIIDSGKKSADASKKATLFDTGNDTKIVTKFSSEELELLKQIQENG